MADYGLDPSVMQYVQGGGMPTGQPASMADPSQYGLDPSVLAGVQNGWAQPQQVSTAEYGLVPAGMPGLAKSTLPPPPPPPAPPQQTGSPPPSTTSHFGVDPSVAGAPSELATQPDSVPSVTGGALQTDMPQVGAPPGLPVQTSPDQVIGTASALTPKQVAATNKVYAAQQQQAAAFANSPEGIAQKADAENVAAIEKQRQANADTEAAQSVQNRALADATAASNERQAKEEKIAAAQRAADQATTAQYSQQYTQQIKDAADFKVNTDRDIGAAGAIAVALSGLGNAIAHVHGPNAALEILDKRADQRIADQWAQKRALGDKASATKGLIDTSRQTATDDRQDQDVTKAATLTDYSNQVKLYAAQAADPIAKAHALALSAGLDQQVANLTTGLANRKLEAQKTQADQQYKNATLGVSYGELGLRRQEHQDALDQQKWSNAIEVAKLEQAGDAKGAAALKAQQDAVTERGAMVPTTVNPDGTAHYEPAMQEDGKTPWLAEKGKVSEELTGFRSATIDGVKAIDTLRQKRAEFSTNEQFDNWLATNEDGRSLLQAQARALLDIHQASGIARLSGEAVELAKQELSGGLNADSVKNLMTALDTSRGVLVDQLDSRMRGAGYTGKKVEFADPLKANLVKTPDEQQLASVLSKPGKTEIGAKGYGLAGAVAGKATQDQGIETQKKIVDNWGAVLNDPKASPEDKTKAASYLDQAVRTGGKGVRDYALSVQTQAAVNNRAGATAPEDASISSGSTARDTSYGGTAQTALTQKQIEQAPLDALTQQANAAPAGSNERRDARQEIIRRADSGDKKAKAALIQVIGGR